MSMKISNLLSQQSRTDAPKVTLVAGLFSEQIEDERVVEPLVRALEDEDKGVRWFAADALGEIGDPRAVEPLRRLLDDNSEKVRDAATCALEAMEQTSGG